MKRSILLAIAALAALLAIMLRGPAPAESGGQRVEDRPDAAARPPALDEPQVPAAEDDETVATRAVVPAELTDADDNGEPPQEIVQGEHPPWFLHIGTVRAARRDGGHRFEVFLPGDEEQPPLMVAEGKTDAGGVASIVWQPPNDRFGLMYMPPFRCRILEPGFLPEEFSFEPHDADDKKRARLYMEPTAGDAVPIQVVDPAGDPTRGELVIDVDGEPTRKVGSPGSGTGWVEVEHLGKTGFIHAISFEHGSGAVPLDAIDPQRRTPLPIPCGSDGGISLRLMTPGGSPIPRAQLLLTIDAEVPETGEKVRGASSFHLENQARIDRRLLRLPGQGLTQNGGRTDDLGRFHARHLRRGTYQVSVDLNRWEHLPVARVSASPSAPETEVTVPVGWVQLSGGEPGTQCFLADVTDGEAVGDRFRANLEDPERTPTEGLRHLDLRWQKRLLLRTDRSYEIGLFRIDGAEIELLRSVGFTPDGKDSPTTVVLD